MANRAPLFPTCPVNTNSHVLSQDALCWLYALAGCSRLCLICRNTIKGPRLFDVFAYNMYGTTGQSAASVGAATSAGLLRDVGTAVPLSVGEYSAFSAR